LRVAVLSRQTAIVNKYLEEASLH